MAPAVAERIINLSQAADILAADTPISLSDGSRFLAPKGWTKSVRGESVVIGAPEGDSHVALFYSETEDADAAVAAAWASYRPGFISNVKGEDRPAREGWETTRRYRYELAGSDLHNTLALALKKGKGWTILIYDVSAAVAERRDSQIEIIFNSLLPQGYARESFAGRKANLLDAMRVMALTDMIENARAEFNIPGVALGLIQDDKVVFAGGFGVRSLGRTEPVDADTLFNVASVGKPLTTLMLAKQVEAGQFQWDTQILSKWPTFGLGDAETAGKLQVKHLICACTGMPRQDAPLLFEGDNLPAASIMEILKKSHPTSGFGEIFQYSNLMAAAGGYFGGYIAFPKRELGDAYDRTLTQLVLKPLGMRATTPDFRKALAGNHAAGHAPDVDGNMRVASQGLNYASISTRPSGNHWSNVSDLLRYVKMELNNGMLPSGRRYIRKDLLLDRRVPQVSEGLNEYYGMGLKIDRQWGVPVIHHGGIAAGYISQVIWLPEQKIGAVLLINSESGSALRAAFRRRLLEIVFDGNNIAEDDLRDDAKAFRVGLTENRQQLTTPANPEALAQLAIRYENETLGRLEVYQKNGATWFDLGGWQSEVASRQNEDGTVDFITVTPGITGFEFRLENSGAVLLTREAEREYRFRKVH